MKKLHSIFFAFCLLFVPFAASAESEQLEINHADSLEILDDRLVLDGNVSVTTSGAEKYTVLTKKLIAYKNSSGDYTYVECFDRSQILGKEYSLKADKIFFHKDPNTQQFNLVDASGNVDINSFDGKRKIQSPKALINMQEKMLYAKGGVNFEQINSKNSSINTNVSSDEASLKTQKMLVASEEQDISLQSPGDLIDSSEKDLSLKKLFKQMEARGEVITNLEGEAQVNSSKAEFFSLNGKTEKALFSGNASFTKPDGTKGEGKVISYYPNTEDIEILAFDDAVAKITKTDGTTITGDQVNYNTLTKTTLVQKQSDSGFRSFLEVPYNDNGKASTMKVRADFIENVEKSESESVLTAHQNGDEELVEVEYGVKRGWGRNLFVFQNKLIPDKQADYLILADKAKILDIPKEQIIEAPVIRIGLGAKDLSAGFTSRARGSIPLKKKEASDNPTNKSSVNVVKQNVSRTVKKTDFKSNDQTLKN